MTNTRIPANQKWLMDRLELSGYKPKGGGVCYGLSMMGIHAILSEEVNRFDKRLQEINNIPLDQFQKSMGNPVTGGEVGEVMQARAKIAREAKAIVMAKMKEELQRKVSPEEDIKRQHTFNQAIQAEISKISPEDNPLTEWAGFAEILTTYQHAQDSESLLPDHMPTKLKEQGGIDDKHHFTGMYNENDLIEYFTSLRRTLEAPPPFTSPVAISLCTAYHGIAVGYDPVKKAWSFIDANGLPSQTIANDEEMAKQVFSAFTPPHLRGSQSGILAVNSRMYVNKSHVNEFNQAMQSWQKQPEFQRLHAVTENKIFRKDSSYKAPVTDWFENTWLKIAVMFRDREAARILLQKGADQLDKNGFSLLHTWSDRGKMEYVKELLRAGANPNILSARGDSALHMAVSKNDVNAMMTLLEYGANPDCKNSRGAPPMQLAMNAGNITAIKLLLTWKADTNESYDGLPLMYQARQSSNRTVLNLFERADALYDSVTKMEKEEKNRMSARSQAIRKYFYSCLDAKDDRVVSEIKLQFKELDQIGAELRALTTPPLKANEFDDLRKKMDSAYVSYARGNAAEAKTILNETKQHFSLLAKNSVRAPAALTIGGIAISRGSSSSAKTIQTLNIPQQPGITKISHTEDVPKVKPSTTVTPSISRPQAAGESHAHALGSRPIKKTF